MHIPERLAGLTNYYIATVHILIHNLCKQVRDMTAFLIHYRIVTHIKITIHSLYCNPLPYCDHNTNSLFFFSIS